MTDYGDGSYSVYELIDPRTNQTRYVGRTDNVHKRYKQHLSSTDDCYSSLYFKQWLLLLKETHNYPYVNVLQATYDYQELKRLERCWMLKKSIYGHLFNANGLPPSYKRLQMRQRVWENCKDETKKELYQKEIEDTFFWYKITVIQDLQWLLKLDADSTENCIKHLPNGLMAKLKGIEKEEYVKYQTNLLLDAQKNNHDRIYELLNDVEGIGRSVGGIDLGVSEKPPRYLFCLLDPSPVM